MSALVQHPIVVDSRTLVRPWRVSDADDLFDQLVAEQNSLYWNSVIDGLTNVERVRAAFEEQAQAVIDGGQIGGAIELDGRVAGQARITRLAPPSTTGVLGYWLFEWARGKGTATKSARTLIEAAFSLPHIDAIEIGMATVNDRSRTVAERLGAAFVEVREEAITRRGRKWDAYVYRISRRTA